MGLINPGGLGNITSDTFSGDNSTVAFTLTTTPATINNTYVFISGVYQFKSTYSVSGTTLTFGTAPPTGTSNIQVLSVTTLSIGTPADGTVTTAKLASTTGSGAVVLATSPTLVTPALGTPSSGTLTNCTGYPGMSDSVVGIVQAAVQSQMETGTSVLVAVTPGRQQFHPGHPKAWVKVNASAVISSSYNVSSVTDGGVGRVVMNLTVSFSSTGYCAVATAQLSTSLTIATTLVCQQRDDSTVSACAIDIIDVAANFRDPSFTHIVALGDQ